MAQTTLTDHPESDQPSSNDAESLQTFDEIEQDANDSTTTASPDAEEPLPKPRRKKTGGRAKGSRNRRAAAPVPIATPEPEPEENEEPEPAQEPEEEDDPEHLLALKSDLFYWLDNLNDETWSRLMVYCYRKEPVWLQDKTGGKPHYIQKMSQRFSADDLKRTQGSGIYRIDVTIALERGGSKRLRTGDVHILDPSYPPNLPVSDAWTKNPVNSKWFWAIPILEAKEKQSASMGQTAQRTTHTAAMPSALTPATQDDDGLVGLARRSQEQLMALSDPTRQLDTVQKIIEMMKPATPPPADAANSPMMLMFNMMMEQNREMRNELKEVRNLQTNPAVKDSKAVILETLELAEALGLRRGGKPEKTDPWAHFLETVIDNAPVIADLFISARQPQQQQPQPAQQPSIPPPQPQRNQPPPEPEEDQEEDEENMSSTDKQQQETMRALEPIIRNSIGPMIEAVKAQKPADLRRWFLDEYGRTNFEALQIHIGPERMAEMATTHPLLKLQLPNKVIMQKFFDEVFG